MYVASNRFTGGADYAWPSGNSHYSTGYQTFDENINFNNLNSPERSVNTSSKVRPRSRCLPSPGHNSGG
jgi:hypothetical protein